MTDEGLERIIGNLLRTGVVLSAAAVAAGGVWYLWHGGFAPPPFHHFRGDVRGLRSLAALPPPQALIGLGLLILVATPVARVVFSLVAFAMERDRMYVAVTLVVLAILLYSIGTAWL